VHGMDPVPGREGPARCPNGRRSRRLPPARVNVVDRAQRDGVAGGGQHRLHQPSPGGALASIFRMHDVLA